MWALSVSKGLWASRALKTQMQHQHEYNQINMLTYQKETSMWFHDTHCVKCRTVYPGMEEAKIKFWNKCFN